jgi:hypothetical protein
VTTVCEIDGRNPRLGELQRKLEALAPVGG